MPNNNEQTVNDKLGEVLREMHPHWRDNDRVITEASGVLKKGRPDIVVWNPGGLPVVIETEFHPAANVEEKDARQRLGKTFRKDGKTVEQVIALRLPLELKGVSQHELLEAVKNTSYEFCLISEKSDKNPKGRWPSHEWIEGGVGELAEFIELASLSENKTDEGAGALKNAIEQAAKILQEECRPEKQEKIARLLSQENDREGQTIKMAMAILVNALVFHIALADKKEVKTIIELQTSTGDFKGNLSKEWRKISSEINYRPIYDLAISILEPLGERAAHGILELLSRVASELAKMGATSRHDFGGQLFQKLINDRKFIASFYTLPASAAFMAELAVSRMEVNWSDRNAITNLRLGDFACGTGALLSATYNAIRSRYRRKGKDDAEIHKDMMEKTFVGFDIMPAATHLTTAVLSSAHPDKIFHKADIATLLYGEHHIKERGGDPDKPEIFIGSLELISPDDSMSLIPPRHEHYSGTEGKVHSETKAPHETFDLVIMNPPFTRTTANDAENKGVPNPAFAGFGTSEEEQEKMAAKRKEIYRVRNRRKDRITKAENRWYRHKNDQAGEGRAGLATWFMDLADVKIKPGCTVAFIIPATFINGPFWKKARTLLAYRYRNILIVNLASPEGMAFSDDTNMAECIVVATRKLEEDKSEVRFSVASIDHRPRNILEAIHFAKVITAKAENDANVRLCVGSQKFGRMKYFSSKLSDSAIGAIQDESVEKSAIGLANGHIHLPHLCEVVEFPFAHLEELGYRRKHANYINGSGRLPPWGPFDIVDLDRGVPQYPALWKHDAQANKPGRESHMIVAADKQGIVREGRDEDAQKYWDKYSSKLHFNCNFRLTSQRLAVCMTQEKVIGGRAWPSFICENQDWNEPIALWMNTTLGLLTFWFKGTRQQQGRATVTLELLDGLPIYNMKKLTEKQIETAKHVFEEFSTRDMLQANAADRDVVRQELDEIVLLEVFGLPRKIMEPLSLLRKKWCREPSIQSSKKDEQ